jgi:hypothetical protein
MKIPQGLVSTLLEVLGLVLVLVAAWLFAPLAGLAVSGVVLVALGAALGARTRL